jgi:hypothetical protein
MQYVENNVYCDESCHLPYDNNRSMVLGAIWCPAARSREIFTRVREIKLDHGLSNTFEIKWNKVSPAGLAFYMDIVDYFFDDSDLHFRGIVIPNKVELNHEAFNQNHDTFYYKMYFELLKVILNPENGYNIYIDIKDTNSQNKVIKLQEVLRNNSYDYHKRIIRKIQQVHSHEVEILQVTDLITGALGYFHRGLKSSSAKLEIIDRIKKRSGYSLEKTTLYKENKMNIFVWSPKVIQNG